MLKGKFTVLNTHTHTHTHTYIYVIKIMEYLVLSSKHFVTHEIRKISNENKNK